MDDLLQKYNDFMRLNNCRAEYLLSNGQTIDFVYKEENFIHLLGLHKLIDIQLIQLFNDKTNKVVQTKYIISRIKKGKLTDAMVRASVFYNDISERYENFSYDNLTTLNYTDAVINFNPSLINSKIKSDYLLFEERINKEYNHLGIAFDKNSNRRYIILGISCYGYFCISPLYKFCIFRSVCLYIYVNIFSNIYEVYQ